MPKTATTTNTNPVLNGTTIPLTAKGYIGTKPGLDAINTLCLVGRASDAIKKATGSSLWECLQDDVLMDNLYRTLEAASQSHNALPESDSLSASDVTGCRQRESVSKYRTRIGRLLRNR